MIDIFRLFALSKEFENIPIRGNEKVELQKFIDQFENNEAQNDRQQKKKEETKSTTVKSGVVPNPKQNQDLVALATPQSES